MNDLQVLVAGCGSIGRRHSRVLHGLGIRNLWICDPLEAQRRALTAETPVVREFDSFDRALEAKPDALFICTPPKMHIPMAIQALQSGAHVFSEKPLADSLDGVEDLRKAIDATGRLFMVGFCFRYHEGLTKAREWLDASRIGRLVSIRCRMGEHLPLVRPDYRTLFTSQYSGAYDLTHEIDLACWYAGQPIQTVKAVHGTFSDIGIQAPDVAEILVQFQRCTASIHLDFFSHPRYRLTELLGTKGTIWVEFSTWDKCRVSVYEADRGQWEHEDLATDRDVMFRREDAEFLDAVIHRKPVRLGLDEACKSLQIVCAAQNGRA